MKSERKQIQESNLLADKIEQQAIKLKNALPAIVAVTTVVVLGLLAYGFYTSVQEKESAKGWTALYFADTDRADLTAISSDFKGTAAGLWAKQIAGDANMARALEKVYLDRDLAEQFYKEAIAEYGEVAEKSTDPFLTGRTNFGLAQASEGMGDHDKALSFYRKVITNKAMSVEMIAEATKRVSWLESKAGEEFYAWYKTSRASSPVLNENPTTPSPLPNEPNISFPPMTPGTGGESSLLSVPESQSVPATTPAQETQKPAETADPNPETSTPNAPDKNALPPTTSPVAPPVELPRVDDSSAEKKPQS